MKTYFSRTPLYEEACEKYSYLALAAVYIVDHRKFVCIYCHVKAFVRNHLKYIRRHSKNGPVASKLPTSFFNEILEMDSDGDFEWTDMMEDKTFPNLIMVAFVQSSV